MNILILYGKLNIPSSMVRYHLSIARFKIYIQEYMKYLMRVYKIIHSNNKYTNKLNTHALVFVVREWLTNGDLTDTLNVCHKYRNVSSNLM